MHARIRLLAVLSLCCKCGMYLSVRYVHTYASVYEGQKSGVLIYSAPLREDLSLSSRDLPVSLYVWLFP